MNNASYYVRVSTDKDDQLNSLENQSKYFREMISDNKNWNLIGEYIDEGISDAQVNKTKNLLKIKNEYHDIIGHRLALLTKYLEQDTILKA